MYILRTNSTLYLEKVKCKGLSVIIIKVDIYRLRAPQDFPLETVPRTLMDTLHTCNQYLQQFVHHLVNDKSMHLQQCLLMHFELTVNFIV